MGKYKKGILGRFRGKIGTVVGSVWKGIYYMRSLPDITTSNPSQAQLNVRIKLEVVVHFLKGIKLLINSGYRQFTNGVTPMNAATSYVLKNAVTRIAPNYVVDYSKVINSVGDLDEVNMPEVATTVAARIDFTWLANGFMEYGKPTDTATFLVYNPIKDRFIYARGITPRSALLYNLPVHPDWSGDTAYCWMSFVSADGKMVSNSSYVGSVPVI